MVFRRVWDSTCPREWVRWESDGRDWVIQDLAPEDDERALEILTQHLVPDEVLCAATNFVNDPISMMYVKEMWTQLLAKRMSLGCYTFVEGKKILVALNVCYVACLEDKIELQIQGESAKNVFGIHQYTKSRCNGFEYLGVDKALHAMGLVVKRDFRGAKLGGRLLAAREPLCLFHGIKATETVFTGPASQKLAARCGFETILEMSFKELADYGFKIPRTDEVVKLMVKKYK